MRCPNTHPKQRRVIHNVRVGLPWPDDVWPGDEVHVEHTHGVSKYRKTGLDTYEAINLSEAN